MANQGWIYEFLYRGFPNEGGAWHLIVSDQFGRHTVYNMEQAEAAGWALPKIIETLNASNMKLVETTRQELATTGAQLNDLNVENQTLKIEKQRLQAALEKVNAEQNPEATPHDGGGSPQS